MDSEEGKLFVGGITWETTEETLRDYFSKYGDVTNAAVMRDKLTGRPRGFGFVNFSDPSALDSLLQDKHTIDGRMVEAKRALSREDQNAFRQDSSNGGRASGGGGNVRTKKIFVGGLPPTLTDEEFQQYFGSFGEVTDAVIMMDQTTQRPRGFGFISFDTEEAVDRVLQKNFHDLNGKDVEVKRALPKDANSASNNRRGGNQNYGSSRGNSGSYDNHMDGNRYMQQPQSAGFSSYPGYSATGYGGYGAQIGSYGGYGGYGGYAGGAGAFPGQAGGYGGSNSVGAGYGGNSVSAMKAAWSNQTAGYGSSGYGAGYGHSAGYGSGVAAQTGQAPGGGAGYGSQAYGGGYGGGGYGAVGGRAGSGPTGNTDGGEQSAVGGGYMGSSYGGNNRTAGYGGYGDSQSWQGQQ